MTEREALKLALDAFGEIAWSNETQWQRDRAKEAITTIKEALAQPKQEPDYYGLTADHLWMSISKDHYDRLNPEYRMTCYPTPPQRTWVGLTDEELPPLVGDNGKYMELQQVRRFYKYIEAKLKEKNT